jgi:hypothetical protein
LSSNESSNVGGDGVKLSAIVNMFGHCIYHRRNQYHGPLCRDQLLHVDQPLALALHQAAALFEHLDDLFPVGIVVGPTVDQLPDLGQRLGHALDLFQLLGADQALMRLVQLFPQRPALAGIELLDQLQYMDVEQGNVFTQCQQVRVAACRLVAPGQVAWQVLAVATVLKARRCNSSETLSAVQVAAAIEHRRAFAGRPGPRLCASYRAFMESFVLHGVFHVRLYALAFLW